MYASMTNTKTTSFGGRKTKYVCLYITQYVPVMWMPNVFLPLRLTVAVKRTNKSAKDRCYQWKGENFANLSFDLVFGSVASSKEKRQHIIVKDVYDCKQEPKNSFSRIMWNTIVFLSVQ